jgi:hypothetical protein
MLRIAALSAFLSTLSGPALAGGHAPVPDFDGGPVGLAIAAGVLFLIYLRKRVGAKT